MFWFQRLSGVVVMSVLLLGCGGHKPDAGVKVKGKVTKGGAPVTVPNMESGAGTVKIELYPVHADLQDERGSEGTLSRTDGTFEIAGAGKGIKPGKYRLSVFADPGDGQDQLGGKFGEANSPINVDVPADKLGGTIDLGTIELDSYK